MPGTVEEINRRNRNELIAVVLILVLAVAVLALIFNFLGRTQKVYLVNGLESPYTVVINGETRVKVPAMDFIQVPVPTGQVHVSVESTTHPIEDQTIQLKSSWLNRTFFKPAYVINPDQCALLGLITYEYVPEDTPESEASDERDPTVTYSHGAYHHFKKVHYPFVDAPDNINLEHGKTAKRTELFQVDTSGEWDRSSSAYRVIQHMLREEEKDSAAKLIRKRLNHYPEDVSAIRLYASTIDIEEFSQWVQPRLDQRPVDVELHRVYQDVKWGKDQAALEMEYLALQQSLPENGNAMFLLARATIDPDLQLERLNSAISLGGTPRAHYSRAALYFSNARFNEAIEDLLIAQSQMPDKHDNLDFMQELYLAAGRHDEALKVIEERLKEYPESTYLLEDKIYTLELAGATSEAQTVVDNAVTSMSTTDSSEEAQELRTQLEDARALAREEFEQVYKRWVETKSDYAFFELVNQGKFSEVEALDDPEELNFATLAVVALKAGRAGQSEVSRKYQDQLIKDLSEYSPVYSAILEGKSTWTAEKILRFSDATHSKMPLLLLLGEQHPEHRSLYWGLARKLNYDKRGDHYLINQLITE